MGSAIKKLTEHSLVNNSSQKWQGKVFVKTWAIFLCFLSFRGVRNFNAHILHLKPEFAPRWNFARWLSSLCWVQRFLNGVHSKQINVWKWNYKVTNLPSHSILTYRKPRIKSATKCPKVFFYLSCIKIDPFSPLFPVHIELNRFPQSIINACLIRRIFILSLLVSCNKA